MLRGARGARPPLSSATPLSVEARLSSLEQRIAAIGERPPRTESTALHGILKDSRHGGHLERAERLMRSSALGQSRTLWNSLMEAHGRVGQPGIAEDIFREQQKARGGGVDAVACRVMIHAWGRAQRPTKAAEYLRLLDAERGGGGGGDVVAWAMAIDAFARHAPHEAERLLDDMLASSRVRPNEVCFNAVIAGYAARGLAADAERLLARMAADGVRPDAYSYTALLQSYARARRADQVEATWRAMRSAGIRPTPVSFHTLAMARASLQGAAGAEAALSEARAAGVVPSAALFNVVLRACAQERRSDRVESHLRAMLAAGVRPTPFTVSAVLELWERLGQPAKMEAFLRWMTDVGAEPDAPCFNLVIAAYCRAGMLPDAERVLGLMQSRGLQPTQASYVALYTAARSSVQHRARAPHYRSLLKQARRRPPPRAPASHASHASLSDETEPPDPPL